MLEKRSNRSRTVRAAGTRFKRHTHRVLELPRLRRVSSQYALNDRIIKKVRRDPVTETAVIVHLYYTDNWRLFSDNLGKLNLPFDLFVTMPSQNLKFTPAIKKDWKNAIVLEVPNRGRDILPFLEVAKNLEEMGYKYLLKLHSKKSTHRTDGQDWLTSIVNSLLPDKISVMNQAQNVLRNDSVALIGPQDEYLSLTVNFEANGSHMTRIISELFDKKIAYRVLQLERQDHGFFAGSMFWARLSALRPLLLRNWPVYEFEAEAGQVDATFAHAIERVFSLIPEIEGQDLAEMGTGGIKRVDYNAGKIPDWSDVYIGPKLEHKKRRT